MENKNAWTIQRTNETWAKIDLRPPRAPSNPNIFPTGGEAKKQRQQKVETQEKWQGEQGDNMEIELPTTVDLLQIAGEIGSMEGEVLKKMANLIKPLQETRANEYS